MSRDPVGGLHVVEQGATGGAHSPRHSPSARLQPGLLQLRGDRHVVGPVVAEVVAVAGQRGLAVPDAARVEADPVVGQAGVVRDEALEDGVDEARAAGAARVDQRDPLGLRVRRLVLDPGDGQLDLVAGGVRVVQRHGEQAALGAEALEGRVGALPERDGGWGVRGRCRRSSRLCRRSEREGPGQHGGGGESSEELPHSSPSLGGHRVAGTGETEPLGCVPTRAWAACPPWTFTGK